MKYQDINAKIIDNWCDSGWIWGKAITHEEYIDALNGKWNVYLTPSKFVPHEWFGNIKGKEMPELVYLFNAMVFRREGKNKELKETLNKLKADYNESWHAWSILADFCADECNYDEAIKCYEKSFELQAKPRYSDPLESVAHIYEITGQYEKAASTYKRIIELLAEDWNITLHAV